MSAEAEQTRKASTYVQLSIRILVSAGLMSWLIYMIDWSTAFRLIKGGSLLFFVAAFIAIQLTVAFSIWKWQLLILSSMEKKQSQHASFSKLGRYYYIGLYFNNFLPGSVGGDVMRIFYLGKNVGMSKATASVAFERITSGAALTAIVLISALFINSVRPFIVPIYIVAAVLIVLFVIIGIWLKRQAQKPASPNSETPGSTRKIAILMNKTKQVLVKLGETAGNYRQENWLWWVTIAVLSLVFQIGLAWINQLLFLGFGIDVSWVDLLVIISLISFITMIPVSLNGIGVREASYVFFFNELGIPEEIAISVSLLFFILVTVSSLVGGLFLLLERGRTVEAIRQ